MHLHRGREAHQSHAVGHARGNARAALDFRVYRPAGGAQGHDPRACTARDVTRAPRLLEHVEGDLLAAAGGIGAAALAGLLARYIARARR